MITRQQAIWILTNLPNEPLGIVPNVNEWDRERQEVIKALREIVSTEGHASTHGE